MTTLSVTSNAGNGYIKEANAVYATAHAGSGTSNSVLDADMIVGQDNIGGTTYDVYRGFIAFDTSSIPSNATITQVNLSFDVTTKNNAGADFDVQIMKQDWSAQSPITAGNRVAAFQNALSATLDQIWRNTSAITISTVYQSPNLDASWINSGGITYYSLISSRDAASTVPANSTNEWVKVAPGNNATVAFRPTLTVVYTAQFSGITSTEQLGIATVAVGLTSPGIPPSERLGVAVSVPGSVTVALSGIPASERLGAAAVLPGSLTGAATGIPTAEALGLATLTSLTAVAPTGVQIDHTLSDYGRFTHTVSDDG